MKLYQYLEKNNFDLSLAAGFFGFYAHLGFVKAMSEFGLKPTQIYGASAGAIVGSLMATNSDLSVIEKKILSAKFSEVFDPSVGFGLLKGNKFHQLLIELLPQNFSELAAQLSVSVFSLKDKCVKIIESGDLVTAVRASSAFPGLFQPVRLNDELLLDGGIGDEFAISERNKNSLLLVHGFSRFPLFQRSYAQLFKQQGPCLYIYQKQKQSVGPLSMGRGAEIFNSVYLKTTQLLIQDIDNTDLYSKKTRFLSF